MTSPFQAARKARMASSEVLSAPRAIPSSRCLGAALGTGSTGGAVPDEAGAGMATAAEEAEPCGGTDTASGVDFDPHASSRSDPRRAVFRPARMTEGTTPSSPLRSDRGLAFGGRLSALKGKGFSLVTSFLKGGLRG